MKESEKTIIKAPELNDGEAVNPYDQCLLDHDGECGSCSKPDGIFTPCPQ